VHTPRKRSASLHFSPETPQGPTGGVRSPAYLEYAGPSAFRWTVSQKNPFLPADHWTSTQPNSSVYSGSLSNDRRIRPFRSGPLSTLHERAIQV